MRLRHKRRKWGSTPVTEPWCSSVFPACPTIEPSDGRSSAKPELGTWAMQAEARERLGWPQLPTKQQEEHVEEPVEGGSFLAATEWLAREEHHPDLALDAGVWREPDALQPALRDLFGSLTSAACPLLRIPRGVLTLKELLASYIAGGSAHDALFSPLAALLPECCPVDGVETFLSCSDAFAPEMEETAASLPPLELHRDVGASELLRVGKHVDAGASSEKDCSTKDVSSDNADAMLSLHASGSLCDRSSGDILLSVAPCLDILNLRLGGTAAAATPPLAGLSLAEMLCSASASRDSLLGVKCKLANRLSSESGREDDSVSCGSGSGSKVSWLTVSLDESLDAGEVPAVTLGPPTAEGGSEGTLEAVELVGRSSDVSELAGSAPWARCSDVSFLAIGAAVAICTVLPHFRSSTPASSLLLRSMLPTAPGCEALMLNHSGSSRKGNDVNSASAKETAAAAAAAAAAVPAAMAATQQCFLEDACFDEGLGGASCRWPCLFVRPIELDFDCQEPHSIRVFDMLRATATATACLGHSPDACEDPQPSWMPQALPGFITLEPLSECEESCIDAEAQPDGGGASAAIAAWLTAAVEALPEGEDLATTRKKLLHGGKKGKKKEEAQQPQQPPAAAATRPHRALDSTGPSHAETDLSQAVDPLDQPLYQPTERPLLHRPGGGGGGGGGSGSSGFVSSLAAGLERLERWGKQQAHGSYHGKHPAAGQQRQQLQQGGDGGHTTPPLQVPAPRGAPPAPLRSSTAVARGPAVAIAKRREEESGADSGLFGDAAVLEGQLPASMVGEEREIPRKRGAAADFEEKVAKRPRGIAAGAYADSGSGDGSAQSGGHDAGAQRILPAGVNAEAGVWGSSRSFLSDPGGLTAGRGSGRAQTLEPQQAAIAADAGASSAPLQPEMVLPREPGVNSDSGSAAAAAAAVGAAASLRPWHIGDGEAAAAMAALHSSRPWGQEVEQEDSQLLAELFATEEEGRGRQHHSQAPAMVGAGISSNLSGRSGAGAFRSGIAGDERAAGGGQRRLASAGNPALQQRPPQRFQQCHQQLQQQSLHDSVAACGAALPETAHPPATARSSAAAQSQPAAYGEQGAAADPCHGGAPAAAALNGGREALSGGAGGAGSGGTVGGGSGQSDSGERVRSGGNGSARAGGGGNPAVPAARGRETVTVQALTRARTEHLLRGEEGQQQQRSVAPPAASTPAARAAAAAAAVAAPLPSITCDAMTRVFFDLQHQSAASGSGGGSGSGTGGSGGADRGSGSLSHFVAAPRPRPAKGSLVSPYHRPLIPPPAPVPLATPAEQRQRQEQRQEQRQRQPRR